MAKTEVSKGKYPIDRPCSACGEDPEMKLHDHSPPFRPGYGPTEVGKEAQLRAREFRHKHQQHEAGHIVGYVSEAECQRLMAAFSAEENEEFSHKLGEHRLETETDRLQDSGPARR